MKASKCNQLNKSGILIEAPKWSDTHFYGKWFLAIAKVNKLWKSALRDPLFMNKIGTITAGIIPDFSICATVLLAQLGKEQCSIVIATGAYEVDEFAMLVDLGFFIRTERRYQMIMPSQLDMAKVKRAALNLANMNEKRYENPSCFLAACRWNWRINGSTIYVRWARIVVVRGGRHYLRQCRRAQVRAVLVVRAHEAACCRTGE